MVIGPVPELEIAMQKKPKLYDTLYMMNMGIIETYKVRLIGDNGDTIFIQKRYRGGGYGRKKIYSWKQDVGRVLHLTKTDCVIKEMKRIADYLR